MKAVIEVEKLVRDYGSLRAVNEISFAVDAGEVFGFLGPNGAGKTTTVHILTTLLLPTAGRALVAGKDVATRPIEARRCLGLVQEESNVYNELTTWGNLIYTGQLYRVPSRELPLRAREIMRAFDLEAKRDVNAWFLSKGMRRRLTIGMALMHRPAVLFLDEPTSGLDVQSARLIREMVRELSATGTSVFLTTHHIEEASQICDRVAIVNRGRIVAMDSPERLKHTLSGTQVVEIAFADSPQPEADLRALPTVTSVTRQGDKWHLQTTEPARVYAPLLSLCERGGYRLLSINTVGPSLEDVFVQITSQADEAPEQTRGEMGTRYSEKSGDELDG